jgi:peptide/nickel transport system permease protein
VGRYILQRLVQAVPTIIGLTIVSFLLVHIVPGGPAYAMLGIKATPARVAAVNKSLGLNLPLYEQYGIWAWQLLHGNFGISYFYLEPVLTLFEQAAPITLAIVGISYVLAHGIAVILGSIQAYFRDGWFDHTATTINYFLYSMPGFWLAILLLVWFAVDIPIFPTGNICDPNEICNFGTWVYHLVLPVATLTIGTVAGWARYMRTSMTDTLVQDYIRTARAKGLSEMRVLFKHAWRNSVLPLITLLGFFFPTIFGGALVIEEIFNIPGMGLLTYNAAIKRDYPIVMAAVVIGGLLVVIGNLVADLLYGLVDPRISYN